VVFPRGWGGALKAGPKEQSTNMCTSTFACATATAGPAAATKSAATANKIVSSTPLPTPLQCSVAETSGIGAEKEKIITEFIISISQLNFKICKIN